MREPKERRFERFERGFDARRYLAGLATRGIRFVGRSEPHFPPLLRQLHDQRLVMTERHATSIVTTVLRELIENVGEHAQATIATETPRPFVLIGALTVEHARFAARQHRSFDFNVASRIEKLS